MTKLEQEKSFTAHWILFGCRENFRSFGFIFIESAAIAQSIHRETFTIYQKSAKLFSHVAFVVYGILYCFEYNY